MLVAVPTLKRVCAMRIGTDIPDPGGHNRIEHVGCCAHPEAATHIRTNLPDPGGHNRVEHVGCCAHPETAVEGVAGAPAAGLSAPQICTVQHHHYRDTVTRFYCPIF